MNLNRFSRASYDARDYQRPRLGHIQYDNLVVSRGLKVVTQLFHDQPLFRSKVRLHTLPAHNRCLRQEEMNKRCQEDGRENDLQDFL